MTTYAKFTHNGQTQTVALFDGLQTDELVGLLKTIFNVNSDIVGILAEKGLVIPISLVAKNPQVVPNNVCKLLIAGSKTNDTSPAAQVSRSDAGSLKVHPSATVDAEPSEENVTEEESIEYVTNEIQKFISGLRSSGFITQNQHVLLSQLLQQNATLLFAAYSVAISANDNEYMAEICKDLGNSLMTKQGRLACEAQDEVLQVCDQLYINNNITENQLLYLRHLTLIRDEAVAKVYDDFQEHNSVQVLAADLHYLANTHPYQTREKEQNKALQTDDEEEEGELSYTAKQLMSGLSGVIALMLRARLLTNTESAVLQDMINKENEFVSAAYDLYKKDSNLDELQDTLLRVVKLEIRKRIADAQEEELNQQEEEDNEEEEEEDEDEEDEDEDEEDEEEEEEDDESGQQRQSKDQDGDSDNFTLEDISIESILQSLRVENIWEGAVPAAFIKAVFIAVIRKQITVEQAKALCDLFNAKYDLVHAAWEVYAVQGDHVDFVDTLRRVVRDLDFSEIKRDSATASKPSTQSPQAEAKTKAAESKSPSTQARSTTSASQTTSSTAQEAEKQRTDALRAVRAAKHMLLKHSLDMLVNQGLLKPENAEDLTQRYEDGDIMVDAAIETYANDRDVVEFLDTLLILANNSREDVEDLMKAAEQDEADAKEALARQQAQQQQQKQAEDAANQEVEDNLSLEDIAFLQVEDIVQEMVKNKMIGPNIAQAFRILIQNKDRRLVLAYETYTQTKNGAELVDTLLRIVIASVESMASDSAAAQGQQAAAAASTQQRSPAKSASSPAKGTVIPAEDQKTVISILLKSKALTPQQTQVLLAMVDEDDFRINRVFSQYEQHKDIYRLMDDLKSLKAPSDDAADSATSNASTPGSTSYSREDFEDGLEDDDDEGNDEPAEESEEVQDDIDDDDRESVEMKFVQVIQSMQLSDIETAALRLAIAKDDESVRRAIDTYRVTSNDAALKQALLHAARETIRNTLENDVDDDEEDGDEEEEEEDEEDDDDEDEEDGDNARYSNPYAGTGNAYRKYDYDQSEDATESDEEEEDDEDDEEGDEGREDADEGVTSKAARDHIFPILVNELVKESIIKPRAGNAILKLFEQRDKQIVAALDAYDQDSDMGGLVMTLQKIVDGK